MVGDRLERLLSKKPCLVIFNQGRLESSWIMFPVGGHLEMCLSGQIRAICNWYVSCLYSPRRINSSPEPYLCFAFVYQNFFFNFNPSCFRNYYKLWICKS